MGAKGVFIVAVLSASFASLAQAEPVSLICTGTTSVYADMQTIPFDRQGAVIDLDRSAFHSPVYGDFSIVRADETTIVFARYGKAADLVGNIDRVSGSMFIFRELYT